MNEHTKKDTKAERVPLSSSDDENYSTSPSSNVKSYDQILRKRIVNDEK